MKIHMEAVTLLSVLFATSSILATAADDTLQDRQLRPGRPHPRKSKSPRKSKRNKSDAPSSTPTEEPELSNTQKLRVVLDDPIVLAASTDTPSSRMLQIGGDFPSFIGSRSINSGDVFDRDSARRTSFRYTQICTVTEGSFPNTIEDNCDISLCLKAPLLGGCAFYKSGGIFSSTQYPVPAVTATKTGGTGVLNFDSGPGFLTISRTGPTNLYIDYTSILSATGESFAYIARNVKLAETLPGFCPSEAGGVDVCLVEGFPEDYNIECQVASLFGPNGSILC